MAALLLLGCDGAVVTDADDVVYLTPYNYDRIDVERLEDRSPTVAPQFRDQYNADRDEYDQLIAEFAARSNEVLQRPDVDDVLGPFEKSFIFSGRYLELVDIYQQHYQRHGVDSIAAPALGWTLVKIGHEPGAQALIDELKRARPDDPTTWVVAGIYHARRAGQSQQAAADALEAFRRVRNLDPNFRGFKTMEPARLDQEIQALERIVPDAPAGVEEFAGVDVPMHHEDGTSADEFDDTESTPPDADKTEALQEAERAAESLDDHASELAESEAASSHDPSPQREERAARDDEDAGKDDEAAVVDEPDAQQSAAFHLANGRRAFQRGGEDNYRAANQHFEQALAIEPDNVAAGIGLLRVAERTDAPREMMLEQVDTLADAELSARQAWELGLFSLRRLNDRDRATSLLERVEKLDPSFARRVDVDSLLD